MYVPHGPYVKAPCCLGGLESKLFLEHVPAKMNMKMLKYCQNKQSATDRAEP